MEAPLSYCPIPSHSHVPLVEYGGQPWCRFCAVGRHRYVEQFYRWLLFSQWGMVTSVPLCIAFSCVLSPIDMTVGIGGQERVFWWYLLFPTAFISAAIAVSGGHVTIQLWDRLRDRKSGIYPWFHPTQALRDWGIIALFFSLLYAPLLFLVRNLPFLGEPANTVWDWILRRSPLIFIIALLVLSLVDRWRWITRKAILPQSTKQAQFMALYASWMVVAYLFVQHAIAKYVMTAPGPSPFIVCCGFAFFFSGIYLVVHSNLRSAVARLGTPTQGFLPVTIALVGPSNAGKTVFLSRAYSLLRSVPGGLVNLEPTPESSTYINRILDYLETKRDWPPGNVQATDIPFSLKYGMEEMVRFKWLDLPGKVFTDPDDPAIAQEVDHFKRHLINADAVAMVIDGEQLAQAIESRTDLLNQHVYAEVGEKLYQRLKQIGEGARPVPLAIIVTKTCRVKAATRLRFQSYLQSMVNGWHLYSQQSGLKQAPVVKIFLSSAVVTNGSNTSNEVPKRPEPLLADQCVEPVMWLAAQCIRANTSLIDHASGFHGRSDLQEYVLLLESLSGR